MIVQIHTSLARNRETFVSYVTDKHSDGQVKDSLSKLSLEQLLELQQLAEKIYCACDAAIIEDKK